MNPLIISTLITFALTAVFDWLSYECINFDDPDNKQAQKLKDNIKNDLGLDEHGVHQFCKASYFIGIALEAASLILIYYNFKHLVRADRYGNAAVVPMEVIIANDATSLPSHSDSPSLSGDNYSTMSGSSLSSVSVSGDEVS